LPTSANNFSASLSFSSNNSATAVETISYTFKFKLAGFVLLRPHFPIAAA
jgi:hypothetical protein